MTDSEKPATPTADKPTTRDIYQRELATNPKWRDVTQSGRGTIIGGVKSNPPKAHRDT